ncbi:MAG: hypothetical protein WCX96_04405 [Bacilli bacterium]
MLSTMQDIKSKLSTNSYHNEDQVCFSVVTGILYKLGWDVWNPNKCSFKYPVKKFPIKDLNTDDIRTLHR